jgi:hypothetical protein
MSRWSWQQYGIEELMGKVLTKIENDGYEIYFTTLDGEKYVMYHEQNCCESVSVEDVIGDFDDLIGFPITMAEEVSEYGNDEDGWGTYTWTFYKLATNQGYVTIRWYGSSNGYYGESVDFAKVPREEY